MNLLRNGLGIAESALLTPSSPAKVMRLFSELTKSSSRRPLPVATGWESRLLEGKSTEATSLDSLSAETPETLIALPDCRTAGLYGPGSATFGSRVARGVYKR